MKFTGKRFRFPRLTPEQQKLAETCWRMAYKLPRRFKQCHAAVKTNRITWEDLGQSAFLGVMRAATEFEPERGLKFVTFAYWCARTYALAAAEDAGKIKELDFGAMSQNLSDETLMVIDGNSVSRGPEGFFDLHKKCRRDEVFSTGRSPMAPQEKSDAAMDATEVIKLMRPREWDAFRLSHDMGTLEDAGRAMGGISKERVRQLREQGILRAKEAIRSKRARASA